MSDARLVIDAHAHLGSSPHTGVDISEDALPRAMAANGIDRAMVMPRPYQGIEVTAAHDRIARLAEREPGRF